MSPPQAAPALLEDESALAARVRAGDVAAFERLYERHAARLFRVLQRLGASREAAEDALQETWLRFADRARTLPEETDLGAWLYTVARNLVRDGVRGDRRRAALTPPPPAPPPPDEEEARRDARAQVARLEAALAALPEASREVLVLAGVEQLPPTEVARLLGLTPEAVRQRLHRARAQLQELLDASPSSRGAR